MSSGRQAIPADVPQSIREATPAFAELPVHLAIVLRCPIRTTYIDRPRKVTLSPWRQFHGGWSSWVRRIKGYALYYSPLAARIYWNGLGYDHELRFSVHDHTVRSIPCWHCDGTGRRVFVPRPASSFAAALGLKDPTPDADGMENCAGCNGKGTKEPIYGAANSFCNTPGLHDFGGRLGPRGLYLPSHAEVLEVFTWCDVMVEQLYGSYRVEE